jgi:hypothetical protein
MNTTEAFPPMQLDLLPHRPALHAYQAYFYSEHQWGRRDFDAETPEQALALARCFAEEKWDVLALDYYEAGDSPVNEIEVCDEDYNSLAMWRDDDLRLRLAARDLLDALVNLEAHIDGAYPGVDLTEARAAIAKATGGAA